jgi:8-oxo-dGTP pyrophosphatase MutT (NUDIX family)
VSSPLPPDWLARLRAVPGSVRGEDLSPFLPPDEGGRPSAVLMLFGTDEAGVPDVLLTERAASLRSHPGQVAFPGGAIDSHDDGPAAAAVREAVEETGLRADGVEIVGELPALYLPPSGFVVTPVLAWWRQPSPISVVDRAEVAAVARVPLPELLDPTNRLMTRHPSGFHGPAFTVSGLYVWGFTAGLLSRVLAFAGLEQPWDREHVVDLPADVLALLT